MKHIKPYSSSEAITDYKFGQKWSEEKLSSICSVGNTGHSTLIECIMAQLAASGVPEANIKNLMDHSVPLFENAARTFCRDVGDALAHACEKDSTIRPALERQQRLEHYSRPVFASNLPAR